MKQLLSCRKGAMIVDNLDTAESRSVLCIQYLSKSTNTEVAHVFQNVIFYCHPSSFLNYDIPATDGCHASTYFCSVTSNEATSRRWLIFLMTTIKTVLACVVIEIA